MMDMYVWIIIAAVVLLLLLYVIASYNALVKARNRVKTQWAQIDVQLTRRAELIPNLVECVKGYASHEKEALERVMRARAAMVGAKTPQEAMAANAQISQLLPNIFALAENYPALKADGVFARLQTELSDTENKVAYARQFYNDTVLLYRDKTEQFPRNIIAGMFGFKEEAFFAADEGSRQGVQVKF
jgi:LemA protein